MELNILICGIGGQGVVLLGNFLRALFFKKYPKAIIAGTESRGVSQREGSVISTVRLQIANHDHVPLINQLGPEFSSHRADIILAMEPTEFLRNINFMHDKTLVVVNSHVIRPKNTILSTLTTNKRKEKSSEDSQKASVVDLQDIKSNINGIFKSLNTTNNNNFNYLDFTSKTLNEFNSLSRLNFVMLGFLSRLITQYISSEEIEQFIFEFFGGETNKAKNSMNIKAFKFGKSL